MGKVYVFLAEGFEEIEAITTIDVLRRAEIKTAICSITTEKRVVGAHGIAVMADFLFEDSDFHQADALVLPGGMPGMTNLKENTRLRRLLLEHHKKGTLLAAICASPAILGELGLLKGVEAVCYPSFEGALKEAKLSSRKVVMDGNIITANSAGVSAEFALKIVGKLKGLDVADKIAAGMNPPAF